MKGSITSADAAAVRNSHPLPAGKRETLLQKETPISLSFRSTPKFPATSDNFYTGRDIKLPDPVDFVRSSFMKKSLLLLSLIVTSPVFAETIPGQAMLDYFAETCPSSGEWTQSALNDSRSLMSVIEAIKSDPDCKSISGAFSQLTSIEAQMLHLAKESETQKNIRSFDAQEKEILIQLSRSATQAERDALNLALNTIQVSRAGLLGRQNSRRDLNGPDTVLALTRAAQMADAAFVQIASNTKCQEKSPTLLTAATGLVSSVGSAVAAVNPALGLGLTAGSAFMGTAIDTFRTIRMNSDLKKIAEGSTAFMGYKCALETMTNRWCNMVDARAFVKFKADLRQTPVTQSLRGALRLNDIEIPTLLDWLLKVRSSAEPQSTADASRQNDVFEKRRIVDGQEKTGLGRINQARRSEYVETDPLRWQTIRSIVKDISPVSSSGPFGGGSSVKNPFFEVYPSGYIPYFLIGIKLENAPQSNNQFTPLDNWWTSPTQANPDIETILENFKMLISLTRADVEREWTEVLRPDVMMTLTSAYDVPNDERKPSPEKSLTNLIAFIEKYPPQDPAFGNIYKDTLERLKTIHDAINETVQLRIRDKEDALEEILKAADLSYGTGIIQARLELLVRLAVLKFIREANPADQAISAQLLASDRFMETLGRYSGKTELGPLKREIEQAMGITKNNLNNFVKVFGKMLTKQLMRLSREEAESDPYIAELSRGSRNELCHLILGAEKASEYVDVRYCFGLKLGPLVVGGPQTLPLTKDSFQSDMGTRGCAFQDYARSEKIYTQWISADKRLPPRRNR